LGEVALEQVGQSWTVVIGDKGRGRSLQQRRTLQIKTTAEGPMAVLRILDVGKHLLPRQQAQLQRSLAAASKNSDSNSSLASSSNHGSSASFAGMSQAADVSRTLPVLSRTNSNSSIIAGSANSMEQQPEQAPHPSSAEAARGGDVRGPAARHHINAKHHMLQRLAAFLSGSSSSNTSSNSNNSSSSSSASSSNNIADAQCITGLACVVRAAPADGGGDAVSALQPCTPLNQAVVAGRGAVSAGHDVAGSSSQAQEHSSAVIMIQGAERSRTSSLGGRCRLRHLLLLGGTVAMTAAAAGAAILSGHGEAACRLGRVTCQMAINRRWARRS